MKTTILLSLTLSILCLPALHADTSTDSETLLFQDDFERTESQEKIDEPGNGWKTNSKSRAKGNKQVDLRGGAMYVYTHPEADHGASVTHEAEFTNGKVKLRFMLEDKRDTLGLNFADLQCKEVHAGHLCAVRIGVKDVQLQDLKTGNMRLDIREAKQAKKELNAEQQAALKGKNQTTANPIEVGKWYEAEATNPLGRAKRFDRWQTNRKDEVARNRSSYQTHAPARSPTQCGRGRCSDLANQVRK